MSMNFLKGAADSIVGGLTSVFDDLHLSGEEKAEIVQKAAMVVTERLRVANEAITARFEMVAKIIESDNKSGDNFTRRARPSVVYFGLFVIFWNYVLMPTVVIFIEAEFTAVVLPVEFWVTWGGITATWTVSRSAERVASNNGAKPNKLLDMINGAMD